MQNKAKIWRASNPIFLICSYLLIGVICSKSTSQFWPNLKQEKILGILCCSLSLLFIVNRKGELQKEGSILPAFVLVIWGFCIAQVNHNNAFFSAIASSEWVHTIRAAFMHKIDRSFTDQASNEFAKTLLFGIKSNISNDLKLAYQALGILHIIAISGMHLDILFKLLEKGTSWLPDVLWAGWFKFIVLLFLVWTYTCIAQAGPSVVRASIFFSVVLAGRFFQLNLFSFNTISTGILLVLLYNSDIISAIGLQLSYAAVVGIHFFYKPITKLLIMDNKLLRNIWENMAISIAAQITAVPILIFYFHSSSSLSIIGNFLFIPASNYLLYGLLIFMIMPDVAGISTWIASALSAYIEKMNGTILSLSHFLHTQEHRYQMGLTGLIYYYFCLFVGYYWIRYKAPNALYLLLLGSCIYSLLKLFSI